MGEGKERKKYSSKTQGDKKKRDRERREIVAVTGRERGRGEDVEVTESEGDQAPRNTEQYLSHMYVYIACNAGFGPHENCLEIPELQ